MIDLLMLAIGYAAAVLTAIAPAPQLIRPLRTKSTKDISMSTFVSLLLLCVLWTIYGYYIKDIPLFAGDLVGALFSAGVIVLKLRYG